MKTIVLCAGYATRMYPLSLNQPKHLLSIAGQPMLNYLLQQLQKIKEIDRIYLVTNHKFFPHFQEWAKEVKSTKPIEVFNDDTTTNENRLGAVGDLNFVIEKVNLADDLLVLAGDNLFQLSLKNFVSFGREKGIAIALHDVKDLELMKKYAEVRLDKEKKVTFLVEKPGQPQSTLAAVCIYYFPQATVPLIKKYLAGGNNPDQPGAYIQWLYKQQTVYGFVFTEKWYDIGNLQQYQQADKEYKKLKIKS